MVRTSLIAKGTEFTQCQCILLICIVVGYGLTVLAVGAYGDVWAFFFSAIISLFFLLLSERESLTLNEILSQKAAIAKM